MTKALTPTGIENAKAGPDRREVPDGLLPGLYLVVQPSGAKSFAVRYRHAGTPRKLTIGAHPAIDLATARKHGAAALRAAAEGRDPAAEKQTAKSEAKRAAAEKERAARDLFENVAREFTTRHAMKATRESSWRETARILGFRPSPEDPTQLVEFAGSSAKVASIWKGRRVQEITKRDVIHLLDQFADAGTPVMANRVLAAVRKLFNWCIARDILTASPCAGVEPPALERSRDRVLSDDELLLAWKAADADGWPFGPLVKLLILTGQRLSEVGSMTWDEVDFEEKLWTIPAERVKNGQRHEVPLSDAAVEILKALPHIKTSAGFVFATRRDAAVSGFSRAKDRLDAAILQAVPEGQEAPAHWTFHDLRRTTASGMARLGVQLPVIEKVLNHVSGTFRGVVGVYQRHSFSDEKREALAVWSAHVEAIVSSAPPTINAVSIRANA